MSHPLRTALVASMLLITYSANAETADRKSWQANPKVVANASKRADSNFEESEVVEYTLPDPLVAADGTPVTRDNWPARRDEILDLFRTHMYGRPIAGKPQNLHFKVVEEDAHDLEDRATRKLVEISFDTPHAGRFGFRTQLFIPNSTPPPVPAVVLLNFNGLFDPNVPLIVNRGFAVAVLDRTQIASDDPSSYRDLLIKAFHGDRPLAPDDGRAIAAWAWAASRIVDYLETDPAIDATRIGVAGHSRMGKTALWAGGNDPRFAIVYSNNSGAGGAALHRRNFGETVHQLNTAFPQWFCENFRQYNDNEASLPVDQHMLIAAIAPRAVYVASADEDLWADPRGEFLSCLRATPVFELLGVDGLETDVMPPLEQPLTKGRIGYHIRRGRHAFTNYDWNQFLNFATRQLCPPTN